MRRTNTATKADRSSAPASQTRPKLATVRPEPIDEPRLDFDKQVDALRIANEYDAMRIAVELREVEWKAELKDVETRLIAAMKATGEKNLTTLHGRVSFLSATDDSQVPDEKAAEKLLASKGIPLPPTMQEWLARHDMAMPMKPKDGLPDRIRFEKNK
jgi:hypothetical protein